jgi:hypothetical protein
MSEVYAQLASHEQQLHFLARTLESLSDESKEAHARADERARLLKDEDEKRANELTRAAKELEIRRARAEIRWSPWQKFLAVVVVVCGVAGLVLEVFDVASRVH